MKSEDPKVLVGIVTYEDKHYIFPKCYEAINSLDYNNYDFIVVDNSKTKHYVNKLRREGYKKIHKISRATNSRDTLSDSQNYVRRYFLEGDYDYVLLVESDLIPDKNLIKRLLSHRVPVAGSLYFIGTGKVKLPCIFFKDYKYEQASMGTRLIKPEEVQNYVGKGLKKVHGCGFGCTLIRRDIMNRFSFWTDERFVNKHSDVYFYMDLENNGIPVYVDTDVVIPHFPSKWEEVKDR